MKWHLKLDATNEISTGAYSKQGGTFFMAMISQPKKDYGAYLKRKGSLHWSMIGKIIIAHWEECEPK